MSRRARAATALTACLVHLLILAPLADQGSPILKGIFRPDAEGTLNGQLPYADLDFEYPPGALAVIVPPALVTDSPDGYAEVFEWEMIAADLVIVLLLALAVPATRERIWAGLAVYTAGIVLVSGVSILPDSAIESAPLPLARFDLVPAALLLAAALARGAGRSVAWSSFLGIATAVKAFPALLYPAFLRGERHPRRVIVAGGLAIAAAAALVLAMGDEFGSAIGYHTGRQLQVESLPASPLLIAHLLGSAADTQFTSGSWNLVASGADVAKAVSLAALAIAWVLVTWRVWVSRLGPLETSVILLAFVIVLVPVLSPQFLFWLLPVSAVAYGPRLPNLLLILVFAATAYVLNYYGGVRDLAPSFVIAILVRNLLLLAYTGLVIAPLFRTDTTSATNGPPARGLVRAQP